MEVNKLPNADVRFDDRANCGGSKLNYLMLMLDLMIERIVVEVN